MTLDTAVLADLAAKAKAATPETKGRWVYRRCDFGRGPVDDYSYVEWGDRVEGYGTAALSVPMARYIAAISPDVAAALLAEVESLRKALAWAFEKAGPFLATHHPRCSPTDCVCGYRESRAALVSEEGSRTR